MRRKLSRLFYKIYYTVALEIRMRILLMKPRHMYFMLTAVAIGVFFAVFFVANNIHQNHTPQTAGQYIDTATKHNMPLDGKVVVLDPGHDMYSNIYDDYIEGVAMLSLAKKIEPLLEAAGAEVYLTRQTGENITLSQRAAIINLLSLNKLEQLKLEQGLSRNDTFFLETDNLKRAMQSIIMLPEQYSSQYMNTPFRHENEVTPEMRDIFELQDNEALRDSFLAISLHTNAMEQDYYRYINGAEVYYVDNSMGYDFAYYENYTAVDNAITFGDIILDNIEEIGMAKNSVKTGNLMVLRETNVPVVLTENGYHSNDGDRALLMSDAFLDRMAQAYYEGILEYFERVESGEI